MKIGPWNTILELIKIGEMSTKMNVAKTVPASYTLPLQTVPDPLIVTLNLHTGQSQISVTVLGKGTTSP